MVDWVGWSVVVLVVSSVCALVGTPEELGWQLPELEAPVHADVSSSGVWRVNAEMVAALVVQLLIPGSWIDVSCMLRCYCS